MSDSPWCTCPPSIRRSSIGARRRWTGIPSRSHPFTSRRFPAKFIVQAALDGRRSKVIGSWNKLLVAAGQIAPGVGNHYAALGAWESQLADLANDRDRPDNLRHPADDDRDAGSHGIFDSKAHGFFDPSFLKTLPNAGRTFVAAVIADARDRRRRPSVTR